MAQTRAKPPLVLERKTKFRLTPEQHRRMAAILRPTRPELSKQHEMLARAIERRQSQTSPASSAGPATTIPTATSKTPRD